MKHVRTFIFFAFALCSIIAFSQKNIAQQEIWGYNTLAGSEGGGLIFKIDPENKEIEPIQRFGHGLKHKNSPSGGKLFKHNNGLFFGVSGRNPGISEEYSELFSYNLETNEIGYLEKVNDNARIVAISESKIFLTATPISFDQTFIYQYDIESKLVEKILTVDMEDGLDLQGYWLKYNDNIYYTSAKLGGEFSNGTLLKIDLENNTATPVFHFNGDRYPIGSLIKHSNNKIYGTIYRTSDKGIGGLFEFDPLQETYQIVARFTDETGGYPKGEIFEANDGNIYGLTGLRGAYNDGCFYKFNPDDNSLESLYDIDDESDEFKYHEFSGGFAQFPNNPHLFGILEVKDFFAGNNGKIYSFNTETKIFEIIDSFQSDISFPVGSMVYENNELLGLVQYDNTYETGGVFAITGDNKQTYFKKSLYGSEYVEDGQNPVFLLQAKNQHLYGMTAYGGKDNKGIVFMIDIITYEFSKLMDLADFEYDIFPYAEGFEIEPGKIIGISGVQSYGFTGKEEGGPFDRYIFEYDYQTNTLIRKKDIPNNDNYGIYGPRVNSKGEMYFSLGEVLYEYDYYIDTLYQTLFDIPDIRDVYEYKENIYYGTMRGSPPNYNMIFKWDRISNEYEEMFDKSLLGGNPNRISPIGKIFISNDTLFCSTHYATPSGSLAGGSYMYDLENDTMFSTYEILHPYFDNHLRRSMLETEKKEYFIQNSTYKYQDLIVEIYQKDQDSTYILLLEEADDVEFAYSLQYGWRSSPAFDFSLRVDLIDVIPPQDLIYWTGIADTNWYNDENWFLNKTPNGVTDIVILPNRDYYPVLDSSLSTAHLEIQKGAEITLSPTASLTSSSIQNIGSIHLLSNKEAKASILTTGDFENMGEVTYTYLGEKDEQVILGSPVLGEMENNFLIKDFDGQEWMSIEDSLVELSAFQAYQFTLDSTGKIDFRGDCNWGDQVFNSEYSGFYPLANPYPSSIDWQKTDLSTINQKALYKVNIQDSSISAFISGVGDASPLIQPTETFWLSLISGDQIKLKNSDRLHAENFEETSNSNELQISVENGGKKDIATICFNNSSNYAFNEAEDAAYPEMKDFEEPHIISYAGDQKLIINQLPDTAMMDISVHCDKKSSLSIKINKNKGFDFVVLEDQILNKRINLLEENYSFDYFVSDGDYPFKLYFEPWALESVNETDIEIYYYPESLVVRSRKQIEQAVISIYDLAGKISLQFDVDDFHYFEKTIQLPTGHYIVQFRNADLVLNKKILVRH